LWAKEIFQVSRIGRIPLLVKLAAVETIDKHTQGTLERLRAARETPRGSRQTRQIVALFGIVSFHRISISLAFRNRISAPAIPQAVMGFQASL
jgi:hypothetical protein